jgi:type IV pilus assembly protein PilW
MKPAQRTSRRAASRGFSLVELMVASTIGLLVALAVTASVLTIGRQFSIVSSGIAAQGSAQIALSLLDGAGRSAGSGFYSNGKLICPTWNAWNGTAVISDGAVFMPARIVAGASATASDTLVFTAGSGGRAFGAVPVLETSVNPNSSIKVTSGDILDNDLAVIGAPGSGQPCKLFQVTGVPAATSACNGNGTSCAVLIRSPNQGLNPAPTAFTTNAIFGFTTSGSTYGPAIVSRVGTSAAGFRQDAFTVQCNALVRFNAFTNATVPACTQSPLNFGTGVDAIATEIVQMQAQYGISATSANDVVNAWVEPSGATWGGTPSAADVGRIKAVRVVVVARSREADVEQVSSACTNAAGVVNTGPCSFQDAAAPVINLSATSVGPGKTWRNYRYRVHQAVIPLRNVIWSDS